MSHSQASFNRKQYQKGKRNFHEMTIPNDNSDDDDDDDDEMTIGVVDIDNPITNRTDSNRPHNVSICVISNGGTSSSHMNVVSAFRTHMAESTCGDKGVNVKQALVSWREIREINRGVGHMEHGEIDELLANFRDPEQLITWASLWGIVDDPVIQLRLIELRCQQILDNETNTSIIDDHEANIQSGCGSDDQLPGPSRQIDDVFSTNPGLVGENSFYNIRKKGERVFCFKSC
ncbi:hypothetical protein ScPMuIL_017648 [Solemya velum]